MLELGSSGSVRGVSSNGHPYRDPRCPKTALAGHVLAAAPAAVQEAIHSGNKPHHLKPSFL